VTEESFDPHLEMVEYRGWRFTVRQTPLDWLVFIALPGGQPIIMAGADRESAIAKAAAWVDENSPPIGEQP
jgi:hypothetical protein